MRTSPVEAVLAGVVTTLKASTDVTDAATGGVYNNVPQNTAFPYLEVTSPTDRREDAVGQLGASVLVDVKAVSQFRGDAEAAGIIDAAIQALNGTRPTVTGHTIFGIAWEQSERFREVINGVVTRHHVATFRVWTGQA